MDRTGRGRLPDLDDSQPPDSAAAEAYRTLRTNIKFATPAGGSDQPARSILLADTGAGADRPAIAANLASGLAQAGDSTLLIDADLRQPRLQRLFGTANEPGCDLPARARGRVTAPGDRGAEPEPPDGRAAAAESRRIAGRDSFRLLLARRAKPPPTPSLTRRQSPRRRRARDRRRRRRHAADRAGGRTRRPAAQRAKEQLLRVGANLLGVILTDAKLDRGVYRY